MNYYDILQISEKADAELIEKAYRANLQQAIRISGQDKIKRIEQIEEAYKILSNNSARRMYDISISMKIKDGYQQPKNYVTNEGIIKERSGKFCTECGNSMMTGSKFCSSCGSPDTTIVDLRTPSKNEYNHNQNTPAGRVSHINQPISSTEPLSTIYSIAIGSKNTNYYLERFNSFDQKNEGMQPSWNWAAFFLGPIWALYRKMYGWFFALWGCALISKMIEQSGLPGLTTITLTVSWSIFAVYANALYHGKIKNKIAAARLSAGSEQNFNELVKIKGGVNKWVVWASCAIPALGILLAIILPIIAR